MKIYLVGGAVRDQLLGVPVVERDWVVVGASAVEMRAQGFVPADTEFPVFRHPETGDEYALARRETKHGEGYRGFDVDAGADVTLIEDLCRRDLTVNAMAQADDGSIIDPYGGRDDLDAGLLRHVSPAFVEDPLRVLRVARFAAKLGQFGFRVAHDTHRLMCEMVDSGGLDHLTAERLWREMNKAMATPQPWRFFEVLHRCGALAVLIPSLATAMGGAVAHDAAGDSEPVAVLKRATAKGHGVAVRTAAVFVSCVASADEAEALIGGMRFDRATSQLIRRVVSARGLLGRARCAEPDAVFELIRLWRGLDRDSDIGDAVAVADVQYDRPLLHDVIGVALPAVRSVDVDAVRAQGLRGAQLGERLATARRSAIDDALRTANLLT